MATSASKRETFSGRRAFIFAAIGSAVGLGNIWRFPYTTYENGGGAFIIPYLIALLTAGIPLLFWIMPLDIVTVVVLLCLIAVLVSTLKPSVGGRF